MNKPYPFLFQQFSIEQDQCAMKLGIDAVILGSWCPVQHPKRILDIGTGTGVLSLMLAQRSDAQVDAIEIDENAFQQAKTNFANSPFYARLKVSHSSLQKFQSKDPYDLIISNPPYFNQSLKSKDKARNKARHTDSLSFDELLKKSAELLSKKGYLAVILPYQEKQKIIKLAEYHGLYVKDILNVAGRSTKEANRILLGFTFSKGEIKEDMLHVYGDTTKYSVKFEELTKAFYLPSTFR